MCGGGGEGVFRVWSGELVAVGSLSLTRIKHNHCGVGSQSPKWTPDIGLFVGLN